MWCVGQEGSESAGARRRTTASELCYQDALKACWFQPSLQNCSITYLTRSLGYLGSSESRLEVVWRVTEWSWRGRTAVGYGQSVSTHCVAQRAVACIAQGVAASKNTSRKRMAISLDAPCIRACWLGAARNTALRKSTPGRSRKPRKPEAQAPGGRRGGQEAGTTRRRRYFIK